MARDLCTPSAQPLSPPPEPSEELLAARSREPFLRAGRVLGNLALGAGTVYLPGVAGKVCGAMVGVMGAGTTVGGLAGLLVAMPFALMGNSGKNWPAMVAIGSVLTGMLAGTIAGGYLGYQFGGEGLSLAGGCLAASALMINTRSSKLRRLESEHAALVENHRARQAAFQKGEQPPEARPLEAPSAIERIGDLVLIGGIRLPQRSRKPGGVPDP